MIYARANRVGVDQSIYRIQQLIESNLTWNDSHIYGRIYRNRKLDSNFVPESFESGKEYVQVFIDDNRAGIIGFYVKNQRDIEVNRVSADIEIICTCDVTKIYTSVLREDEKALIEVAQILDTAKNLGLEITKVKTMNSDVFADFDKEPIKFRDMQPFASFSFVGTLTYTNNLCF